MLSKVTKTGLVVGMCLALLGLAGCKDAASLPPAATEPEAPSAAETEETAAAKTEETAATGSDASEESQEASDNGYEALYAAEIDRLVSEGLADEFLYVNIDEDDVPELVASDSAGSFDHDNAFIYTIADGKAVLLAGAVTGVDGKSLGYSKGNNIIRESGGIAGSADVFSKIENGALTEVFRAEMIDTLEANEDDEEIYKYSVNGKEVDKAQYLDELSKFVEPYDPFTSIDYDALTTVKFMHDEDSAWFEKSGEEAYKSADEIK